MVEGRRFRLHRRKRPGRGLLDGADDSIRIQLLAGHQSQDGQAQGLHVLCQVDSELLPRRQRLSTEPTGLILWPRHCLRMTLLNPLPGWILGSSPLDGGFRLDLGLRKFMLADQMLEEIVPTVTGVSAVFEIAGPPLEVLSNVSQYL